MTILQVQPRSEISDAGPSLTGPSLMTGAFEPRKRSLLRIHSEDFLWSAGQFFLVSYTRGLAGIVIRACPGRQAIRQYGN